jgi:hypothetical protein
MPPPASWKWQREDGGLDMDALLREFQLFWQTHSEIWEQSAEYTEAFPHLLLMAFLQRITNGEGRIEREYAAGRGRMDLAVEFRGEWNIIEIKLLKKGQSFDTVKTQGLEQISRYRDTINPAASAYLVVFDRRSETREKPWEERIGWDMEGTVRVVRC